MSTAANDLSRPSGERATPPLRFVTAASLFDGHDAAINIMRRLIQAQGVEVVHLGHNRSVDDIVLAAIQEDAARTMSSTLRLWPRCTTSTPRAWIRRRMMLMAASWPSNSDAAVTNRSGVAAVSPDARGRSSAAVLTRQPRSVILIRIKIMQNGSRLK